MNCYRCEIVIEKPVINQKYCARCSYYYKKFPKTTMTAEQITKAKSLIGLMTRAEIAKSIGVSISNLKRGLRGTPIINVKQYPQEKINEILSYYQNHTLPETKKKFPNVKVKSVFKKKNLKLINRKLVNWQDEQFYELFKMSGLISFKDQARYFNRGIGSIISIWTKRFKNSGMYKINGLKHNTIKPFIQKDFKYLRTASLKKGSNYIKLCLYCDLENNLNKDAPYFLVQAISSLAMFQRWIHGAKTNKECKSNILMLIAERSSNTVF